jgi:transposase
MQRTPGKTQQEKEKYWTRIIEEGRKYPAGVAAYCTDNSINKNTFYYWFKRLRAVHPEWQDLANIPAEPRKKASHRRSSKNESSVEIEVRPRRRKFNAKEKARILKEVDASSKGQIAAILRREGVYSTQLKKWRTERELAALAPKKRGPKSNPLNAEVKKLRSQLSQAEKQLKQANAIIELQKKISELLGITVENDEESSQKS